MSALPRVLILHNRYRQPGGEDRIVAAQARLLREKGHEVRVFEKDNREIDGHGFLKKAALFFKTAQNLGAAFEVARIAAEFRPQLALVHNTLPLLSPSIYAPLKNAKVKVVQYLHNYRLLCPAGTLFRDGQPCRLCLENGLKHAVEHRCWNRSRLATLAVTRMLERHRRLRTWHKQVDVFVALNSWMRDQFAASKVVPEEKLRVQPNFTEVALSEPAPQPGDGFVFLGRLTPEKGLETLARAWDALPQTALKVVGEAPPGADSTAWKTLAARAVFTGQLAQADAWRELARARALVFPSLWQEPFGLSLIEAMALGKPVIAARVAGPREIVQDNVTGLLFEPGDAEGLAACVRRLEREPALAVKLGQAGRARHEQEYSPAAAYRRLAELWI